MISMESLRPVTVSEVNGYLKDKLDGDDALRMLCVEGEVSNLTNHYSGHLYFSLKDRESAIKAVMFKGYRSRGDAKIQNGMTVLAIGDVSVFARDGVYQLYVKKMLPSGMGRMYVELEALKAQLAREGIFDESHKKPIPPYAETIGVITSPEGAALQDIKNILSRRYAGARIRLYPVLVQGSRASAQISAAIRQMDEEGLCDVAILARGGGSMEDLYPFNSREIALAIYQCATPLITAIGHETDFTVADLAADLRAPTPSAAAELAVPEGAKLLEKLAMTQAALEKAVRARTEGAAMALKAYEDYLPLSFARYADGARQQLAAAQTSLERRMEQLLGEKKAAVALQIERLEAGNPLRVLQRGYAVVKKDGAGVSAKGQLAAGDRVEIIFQDGAVSAEIKES